MGTIDTKKLTYKFSDTEEELLQILDLQSKNLGKSISIEEQKEQGFITIQHSLENLKKQNIPYPHSICIYNKKVVGYALIMLQEMKNEIEDLKPMFHKIDELKWKGKSLKQSSYFTMGQICIDKDHRSKGMFYCLYEQMEKQMSTDFEYMITEVASRNKRSMKAHLNAGFEVIDVYRDHLEEWQMIIKELR